MRVLLFQRRNQFLHFPLMRHDALLTINVKLLMKKAEVFGVGREGRLEKRVQYSGRCASSREGGQVQFNDGKRRGIHPSSMATGCPLGDLHSLRENRFSISEQSLRHSGW